MSEEREDQTAGGGGGADDGIEAAARMGADLAGQARPDDDGGDDGGRDDGGLSGREALYAEVLGPYHLDYFLHRFRRFEARGGAWDFTWNWPCLFFGPLWFLYRKMYAWAAALIFLELVLMPALAAAPGLSLLVTLAYKIGVPASANWLYFRHVGKVVAQSREAAATDAERGAWRRARGGVSWVGPIVVMVVAFLGVLWAVSGGVPGL